MQVGRFSHYFPIVVRKIMGLTWDLQRTYLGLTTDLLEFYHVFVANLPRVIAYDSIPNASRMHPECIPDVNETIELSKTRNEIARINT